MELLIEEIVDDLLIELAIAVDSNDAKLLRVKVKNALLEVKEKSHYPSHYTDKMINKDLQSKRTVIHNVAMYDYCQVGQEWQSTHSESNVNMSVVDRSKLFTFLPFSNF